MSDISMQHVTQCLREMQAQGDLPGEVDVENLSADLSLADLGLDSLSIATLGMLLEDTLEIDIEWEIPDDLETLGQLLAAADLGTTQ